eukprot:12424566-Karenia_brevis.AAC.1
MASERAGSYDIDWSVLSQHLPAREELVDFWKNSAEALAPPDLESRPAPTADTEFSIRPGQATSSRQQEKSSSSSSSDSSSDVESSTDESSLLNRSWVTATTRSKRLGLIHELDHDAGGVFMTACGKTLKSSATVFSTWSSVFISPNPWCSSCKKRLPAKLQSMLDDSFDQQ